MKEGLRKQDGRCIFRPQKRLLISFLLTTLLGWTRHVTSFVAPSSSQFDIDRLHISATKYQVCRYRLRQQHHIQPLYMAKKKSDLSNEELKEQLTEYLEKRSQQQGNTDDTTKDTTRRVIGGTRGNAVLEFVSGAPVKEQIIDNTPNNIFDYDELSKYGYSHLITPIMNMKGGRWSVYDLMNIERPAITGPPPKKNARPLIIDRTGREDKARYTGLKMGQIINDDAMAEALERANQKAKQGEKNLRAKLMEEEYIQPFADRRNTGPALTPDWTPERLDEYAKAQGRAQAWARKAKMGEFVKDPYETLDLPLGMRLYAILTAMWIAFAYGRATPNFLTNVVGSWSSEDIKNLTGTLSFPGLILGLVSIGSCVLCAALLAPERNRSSLVWGIKGFFGGPLAISQLRTLDLLITREEDEKEKAIRRKQ